MVHVSRRITNPILVPLRSSVCMCAMRTSEVAHTAASFRPWRPDLSPHLVWGISCRCHSLGHGMRVYQKRKTTLFSELYKNCEAIMSAMWFWYPCLKQARRRQQFGGQDVSRQIWAGRLLIQAMHRKDWYSRFDKTEHSNMLQTYPILVRSHDPTVKSVLSPMEVKHVPGQPCR